MQMVERLAKRIEELIDKAEQFRPAGAGDDKPWEAKVSDRKLWQFFSSSLQAVSSISRILPPEENHYYLDLKRVIEQHKEGSPLQLDRCMGILEAISDDIKHGLLRDIRNIIAAEVFTDLLEMASYLLQEKYHLPAGAIAGAVLEDTLRKVCDRHQITWAGNSSISTLNEELYKNKVVEKLQWRQVQAWGDLRNKIDHGQFTKPDEIPAGDVKRMVEGVRDFALKYLA